jgi:large subunit ribosomal protein L9
LLPPNENPAKKKGGENYQLITNIDIADALAKGNQSIDRKFITSGIVNVQEKYTVNVRLQRCDS